MPIDEKWWKEETRRGGHQLANVPRSKLVELVRELYLMNKERECLDAALTRSYASVSDAPQQA
jgi:hypothetical protein